MKITIKRNTTTKTNQLQKKEKEACNNQQKRETSIKESKN
jgi:hypothetical protein